MFIHMDIIYVYRFTHHACYLATHAPNRSYKIKQTVWNKKVRLRVLCKRQGKKEINFPQVTKEQSVGLKLQMSCNLYMIKGKQKVKYRKKHVILVGHITKFSRGILQYKVE